MRLFSSQKKYLPAVLIIAMSAACSGNDESPEEIVEVEETAEDTADTEDSLEAENLAASEEELSEASEVIAEDLPETDSEIADLVEDINSNNGETPSSDQVVSQMQEHNNLGQYVVQPGESLSLIAKRIYQRTSHWRHLADLNQIGNPERIFPGDIINYEINAETERFHNIYTQLETGSVIVAAGDSLSNIAQKIFGQASYWRSIWRTNPELKDPNVIEVGQTLVFRDPVKLRMALGEPIPSSTAVTEDKNEILQEMPDVSETMEPEQTAEIEEELE